MSMWEHPRVVGARLPQLVRLPLACVSLPPPTPYEVPLPGPQSTAPPGALPPGVPRIEWLTPLSLYALPPTSPLLPPQKARVAWASFLVSGCSVMPQSMLHPSSPQEPLGFQRSPFTGPRGCTLRKGPLEGFPKMLGQVHSSPTLAPALCTRLCVSLSFCWGPAPLPLLPGQPVVVTVSICPAVASWPC